MNEPLDDTIDKKLDRLYELLPVIYRRRDAEYHYPLKALLRVISEQVNVVEGDIKQLYENWFIETCEAWVVPYIGDLLGYEILNDAGEPDAVSSSGAQKRERILIPRRDVANTIRSRRRKGTLALLEQLANDAAGWPARAVEFYKLLAWTQNINHLHPHRARTVDLRDRDALELIDGPFDKLAHSVDVRRINSNLTTGRYNIPSVGVFVWRLKSYSVSRTNLDENEWKLVDGCAPARCLEEEGLHCYTFSVLGNDTPLYNYPQRETDPTHIAGELNLPTPIRRHAFGKRVLVDGIFDHIEASPEYYGVGKSLAIWAPGWPTKNSAQPVPANLITPADLTDWYYTAPKGKILVDPEKGRIVFPLKQLPRNGVRLYYNYAFGADLGGGEYSRIVVQPDYSHIYRVGQGGDCDTINQALSKWATKKQSLRSSQGGTNELPALAPKAISAVIEIMDSDAYTEKFDEIILDENESLQIRAAIRTRPVIRLLDYGTDTGDALRFSGAKGSRVILDGLLITGRGIQINGWGNDEESGDASPADDLCDVTIRHCTLVPGWNLNCDCECSHPDEPSIELQNTTAHLIIERSIIGSIEVILDHFQSDPVQIDISDSIWDSASADEPALSAPEGGIAYTRLKVLRCTVFGGVMSHEIILAENSIFRDCVRVARRQIGCMRFCYVHVDNCPSGKEECCRTPRRYECQPDLARSTVHQTLWQNEELRVKPQFNSTRYGTPTYCQLADTCADEIKTGADDESEMGVFHDLFQPQRAANLRARLDEYTPAGTDAGIIFAT